MKNFALGVAIVILMTLVTSCKNFEFSQTNNDAYITTEEAIYVVSEFGYNTNDQQPKQSTPLQSSFECLSGDVSHTPVSSSQYKLFFTMCETDKGDIYNGSVIVSGTSNASQISNTTTYKNFLINFANNDEVFYQDGVIGATFELDPNGLPSTDRFSIRTQIQNGYIMEGNFRLDMQNFSSKLTHEGDSIFFTQSGVLKSSCMSQAYDIETIQPVRARKDRYGGCPYTGHLAFKGQNGVLIEAFYTDGSVEVFVNNEKVTTFSDCKLLPIDEKCRLD